MAVDGTSVLFIMYKVVSTDIQAFSKILQMKSSLLWRILVVDLVLAPISWTMTDGLLNTTMCL